MLYIELFIFKSLHNHHDHADRGNWQQVTLVKASPSSVYFLETNLSVCSQCTKPRIIPPQLSWVLLWAPASWQESHRQLQPRSESHKQLQSLWESRGDPPFIHSHVHVANGLHTLNQLFTAKSLHLNHVALITYSPFIQKIYSQITILLRRLILKAKWLLQKLAKTL